MSHTAWLLFCIKRTLLQHTNHGQFQRAICVMANSRPQSIHSVSAAHRQPRDLVFCGRSRQGVLKASVVFILGISSLVFSPSSLFNHSHLSIHRGLPSLSYSKSIPLFLALSPSCLPHQHPVPPRLIPLGTSLLARPTGRESCGEWRGLGVGSLGDSASTVYLGLPRQASRPSVMGQPSLLRNIWRSWHLGSGICPLAFPWTREEVVNHPWPLIGSLSGPRCFPGTGTLTAEFVLCFHRAGSLLSWLPFLGCFITLELQVLEGMWNIHICQSGNFRSFGIKFHHCSNTLE